MKNIFFTLTFLLTATLGLNAQVYHLGQVITNPDGSQGVVFYLSEDGSSGWMVALHDAALAVPWGLTDEIEGLNHVINTSNDILSSAFADTDGYSNTLAILNHYQSAGYTGQYAASVVDISNGWYLPAAKQLKMLYVNAIFYEPVLESIGEKLGLHPYWSSTQETTERAWCVHFGAPYPEGAWAANGQLSANTKTNTELGSGGFFAVRPIRDLEFSPLPHIGYLHEPAVICNEGPIELVMPNLINADSYGWEIADNAAFTNPIAYTGQILDMTYNGWYLRLWATNEEGTSYSNAVRISVYESNSSYTTIVSCEPYEWNGQIYDESGNYQAILVNQWGCDSIATLELTVNHSVEYDYTYIGCGNYNWNGQLLSESGVYYQIFPAANGCDSIVTLNLTISDAYNIALDTTVCESYVWNGHEYTQSGQYEQTFIASNDCDSIVSLNLVVEQHLEPIPEIAGLQTIFVSTEFVQNEYRYFIDSVPFATHYEWTCEGPDWIVDASGTQCTLLTTTPGITTLKVRAWNCCGYVEQEIIILAGFYDIDDNRALPIRVFPNPANDKVFIEAEGIICVRLCDLHGQCLIKKEGNNSDMMEISLNSLASSIYTIEILTEQGRVIRKLNVTH